MPSTTATSPDTLVTLKINFNGNSRRLKLPLRDLGAATLEDKVGRLWPLASAVVTQQMPRRDLIGSA